MSIITKHECDYCDENYERLGLFENHWENFKLIFCNFNHDMIITKEKFENGYIDKYDNLGAFAKSVCEFNYDGTIRRLPEFIRYSIDWDKIWETLSYEYIVYENQVFKFY